MKDKTMIRTLLSILILLVPLAAGAADYPHLKSGTFNVGCGDCHWVAGSTPPWATVNVFLDPLDNTVNNRRCLRCHDQTGATLAVTHSSATTGSLKWTTQGGWTSQCTTCHDPHNQMQSRTYKTESFVVTGGAPVVSWVTGNATTMLTLPAALSSNYAGYYILPDKNYPLFYKIISSDTTGQNQVEVKGYVNGSLVKTGGYAITYARNIKSSIAYTNPGGRTINLPVKFYAPTGQYGQVNDANLATSVCAVCHSQTSHMRAAWATPLATTDQWHGSSSWGTSAPSCLNTNGCHQQHPEGFKKGATCGDCHGSSAIISYPTYWNSIGGNDLTKQIMIESVTTVARTGVTIPGAHVKHEDVTKQYYADRKAECYECHNTGMSPQPNDVTVGDYVIQVGFKAFGWYTGGTYKGQTPLTSPFAYGGPSALTADNSLVCANVYCHGGTMTSWSTIKWSWNTVGCGDCHKATAANPPTLGSHAKHAGSFSSMQNAISCSKCHPHAGWGTNRIQHIDGMAQWNLGGLGDSNAKYKGSASGLVTIVPSASYGNCTTAYCHSNGLPVGKSSSWKTVQWGGAAMTCTSCHNMAGSTAAMSEMSSAHAKHAATDAYGNAGRGSNAIGCDECHYLTTTNNTVVTGKAKHLNFGKDVDFNTGNPLVGASANSYNTVARECSNIYCHSSGKGGTAAARWVTVSWTASALACNDCHGSAASTSGVPTYANGGTATATANSHMVHWATSGIGCQKCHYQTTRDGSTVWVTSRHVDGNIQDVYYDAVNPTGWYSIGNKSCGSTYCHGTGKPQWGGGVLACAQCHAVNGTIAGKHAAHWATNDATDRGAANDSTVSNYKYRCGVCHYNTPHAGGAYSTIQDAEVVFDPAIAGGGNYVPGAARGTDPATNFKWTAGTCTSTYCHSDGKGNAPAVTNFNWNTNILNCAGCHNYTPASGRWLTTGMHAEHTWSSVPFSCDKCHDATTTNGVVISDKSKHVNVTKEVAYDSWNSTGGWATATKTCSNVFCHSTVQANGGSATPVTYATPTWTSTGSGACGTCHLTKGPWSSFIDTGSHISHLTNVTINGDCNVCHNTAGSGTPKHVNRNIEIVFSGGGSYSQFAANTPGNGYGSCASICHGNGFWGSSGSVGGAGCSLCHQSNNSLAGKHSIHYGTTTTWNTYGAAFNNSTSSTYIYTCGVCHYTNPNHKSWTSGQTVVAVVFDPTIAGGGTYAAGTLQGTDPNGYNWSNGQCSNTYCHSSGNGAAPNRPVTNWNWATANPVLDCKGCHNYTTASGTWMTSGVHAKHVNSYPYDCSRCHTATTGLDAWQTITNKNRHVDGTRNVDYDSFNPTGAWATSTKTCSSTYCHSTGAGTTVSVSWTSAGSGACGSCHGANNVSAPWSSAHAKHTGTAGSGYRYACYQCHNTSVNQTADSTTFPTIKSSTIHVNGTTEVAYGSSWNTGGTWATSSKTCSTTYCHSTGTTVATGGAPSANNITWSATANCGSCHGNGNSLGWPTYNNGSPKTNSHVKHTTDCSKCHSATTSDGTTIASFSAHANRQYDVTQKAGFTTFSYWFTTNGGSCSNISCHYNNTAKWGATLTCNSCHAALSGAHNKHVGSAFGTYGDDSNWSTVNEYRFNCGNCHPVDANKHANDILELELWNTSGTFKKFNLSTAWVSHSGSGQNAICDSVYCHSNGADPANIQYVVTPAWGTVYSAVNKCGQCHDNPPQYAGQAHYMASGFMGKEGGHLLPIHFDNVYNGTNGLASWSTTSTAGSHGNGSVATTITCYVCHSDVVSWTTIDTYSLNNVGSSKIKCSNASCHGTLQNGGIADYRKHVNGLRNVSIANMVMKSKAQLKDASLPTGWTRSGGYKGAGAYDWATIKFGDWNTTTKTCTTACHLNNSISWSTNVSQSSCTSCHTRL